VRFPIPVSGASAHESGSRTGAPRRARSDGIGQVGGGRAPRRGLRRPRYVGATRCRCTGGSTRVRESPTPPCARGRPTISSTSPIRLATSASGTTCGSRSRRSARSAARGASP
jgi:hypothetical protein